MKPQNLPEYWQFAYFNDAFTSEECDIIASLFPETPKDATLGDASEVNEEFRKAKIDWLHRSETSEWIFSKIWNYAVPTNDRHWRFQLSGFFEALQLTKYSLLDGGGYYDFHQDNGPGNLSIRKLSAVVQLTDPAEYEGCELQMQGYSDKMPTKKGSLILFPSFAPHRVTPLVSGERKSLVAWISGEPYR